MNTNTLLLATLATLAVAVPAAQADIHHRHGSQCAPKYTSRDLVGADERGIYNGSSTTTASVTCSAVDRKSYKVENWHWYDANGRYFESDYYAHPNLKTLTVFGRDLSTTVPFSCYVFWTEETGFSSWGPTRFACSASGGCPDSTSEFVGTASLTWSLESSGIEVSDSVGVVCNLPPSTSSGSSYVKSIRAIDGWLIERGDGVHGPTFDMRNAH